MLPALWQARCPGVNFQTVNGNLNQMITAQHSASGWRVSVEPEYYGLLAFAAVAPAGWSGPTPTVCMPFGSRHTRPRS